MTEATIKAFRVTVKDLETGETIADNITPLVMIAFLKNANEKEERFIQGIAKKSMVNTQTMLHACDVLNGMKRDIVHHIAKNLGKSLGLKPFTEEDGE
nr:MAG TPA: hypothetical protein [Caudoviricetes sp.]